MHPKVFNFLAGLALAVIAAACLKEAANSIKEE